MRGLFWHEGRQEMHCKLLNVFDSSAWELRTPQKKTEIYCIDNNKILKTFSKNFFSLSLKLMLCDG